MRAIVQRVHWAEVEVAGGVIGRIGRGLLVYVGVARGDTPVQAAKLAEKVSAVRVFSDAEGRLNLSVQDVGGSILAVSNFTLLADTRKGRRPAFAAAAPGRQAQPIHEAFVARLDQLGCQVVEGRFGAEMLIRSQADGPVNIIVDFPAPAGAADALAPDGAGEDAQVL